MAKKDKPANGNGPRPDERREEFESDLRVILTTEQVAERADRAAHLLAQRDNKVDMAKAAAKQAKSEIDEIDANIRRLGAEVRDKACYQPTPCIRVFDYRRGVVTESRKDTGEVLHERVMTPEERQMAFDDRPKGDDADGDNSSSGSLEDEFQEPAH